MGLGLSGLSGRFSIAALPAGHATRVGEVGFEVPALAAAVRARFVAVARAASGVVVAQGEVDLYFFPTGYRRAPTPLRLGLVGMPDDVSALVGPVEGMGYMVHADPTRADVVVSIGLNEEAISLARAGKPVLAVVESAAKVAPAALPAPLEVLDRRGSGYEGDWASSFSWLYSHRQRTRIPSGPRLDWAYATVIPDAVLVGPDPAEIGRSAGAALFVGWAQKPAALSWPVTDFGGTILVTTLRLRSPRGGSLGEDPAATVLFADFLEARSSGEDPSPPRP